MIGETAGAEAGEDAEDKVEGAGEKFCGEAHGAGGGDAEVGDEPKCAGGEGWGDPSDQSFEIGLGEAVEEEVSDDEVVFFSARRGEGQCVGVVGLQAECSVGCGCFAAAMEECEHGGAGVDGVGFQLRVLCEESSEEAAVSVAED